MNVGIVGLGNIGSSLFHGFKRSSFIKTSTLVRDKINNHSTIYSKNIQLFVQDLDTIFLCLKSNQVKNWVTLNSKHLTNKHIVLVQSGIKLNQFETLASENNFELYRAILNINCSENLGHIVLLKEPSKKKYRPIKKVLSQLGTVLEVENENELDSLSLLTGCYPAIVTRLVQELNYSSNTKLDEHIELKTIIDVMINTLEVIKIEQNKTDKYLSKICTEGGSLEQCVLGLDTTHNFSHTIRNWLNPLKDELN